MTNQFNLSYSQNSLMNIISDAPDSSSADNSTDTKSDLSPSSSSDDVKTSKPSFFDTFDPYAALNQTSTTESSTSSGKPSFFDTFDPEKFLSEHNATDSKDEGKNTNISDLEDSFGGSTAKPDPVIPTRPKTGLYFLVDWNSFLEVGEEGNKDRVSLKFAPKAGDRTRFLPVQIP